MIPKHPFRSMRGAGSAKKRLTNRAIEKLYPIKHKLQSLLLSNVHGAIYYGRERSTAAPLRAAYFGSGSNLEYWLQRVFREHSQETMQ